MKRSKRRILSLLLSACMTIALLSSCSSNTGSSGGSTDPGTGGSTTPSDSGTADPGQTYELSFTIHDPATSSKTQKYEELAAAVKEATNGAVNITVFSGGTLVASTDVADMVEGGGADMGWLFTTFFPGQFPLTEVISLPMVFTDSITSTKTLLALYEQSPDLQEELSRYKILSLYCNPINYVYSNKPVHTVEDMAGQQLRAPSGVPTDMLTAWGAVPVMQGPGDVYQSVEKGVLDGCTFEWSGFDDFRLWEVIKTCTEIPVYCGIFLTVMNHDSYNRLPAEYQEAIGAISGREASLASAQAFVDAMNDAVAEIKASNGSNGQPGEFITPTEEEIAGLKVAADEYAAQWCENITATTGVDGAEFLALAQETIAQYE